MCSIKGRSFHGKVLRVDLSSGRIEKDEIQEPIFESVLGGRGLNVWFLLHEL